MKYLWIFTLFFLFNSIASNTVSSWDSLPTTREDIVNWFEEGVNKGASHILIVYDRFSYDDFPDYVYWESPQERVNYWNSQDLFSVMEVYDLSIDMNEQIDEFRSWNLDYSLSISY